METASPQIECSVVIPTYNRANDLQATLASLATVTPPGNWEVIAVDNNSTDATRQVVADAQINFPVQLRYVFEPTPGRSAALNAGIKAAQGKIVATTDDDVRFETNWLQEAVAALQAERCDFVGGKVLPFWGGPKPEWLSDQSGPHWAVIALLDFGPDPVEFGERYAPLGVNLAFKREAFDRAGLWNPAMGRKAGTLLGQEVREWMLRARDAGLRGMYAPRMIVRHLIPRDRLNKRYFRQWFYWHGVSRAMLFQQRPIDMCAPEETKIDFSKVRFVFGVPRYIYRVCLRSAIRYLKAGLSGQKIACFEQELRLWFFFGIFRQRWKDRRLPPGSGSDVGSLASTVPRQS